MGDYRSADAAVEDRVADLLARLSVEEKVAQLCAVWLVVDPESKSVGPSSMSTARRPAWTPEEAIGRGIGHISRPLGSQPIDPEVGATNVNHLQRRLVSETRWGIPAICHEECLSGAMFRGATAFPSPLNMASTWDPELVTQVTTVIRRQMRAVGAHQGLAPVCDVARDARWGRVEETMGEDPWLVGQMVTAYVRGLQGDDWSTGVIATLKHFVGYSGSEGGRNFAPTHVGPRELADVFLVPFEAAVRHGGARSVMNSYQEIDGEPPIASRRLLTGLLREAWGFDGFTVSDYWAISHLDELHKVAGDRGEAAAMVLHAGLDVELPDPVDFADGIPDALQRGLVSMAEVDEAVGRVLRAKFLLGLFESPYVDVGAVTAALRQPADSVLAATVARRSIVLLANDGTLPLVPETVGSVAVIGPNAADSLALFGNYSFENHVASTHFGDTITDASSVLQALVDRCGAAHVVHVPGCGVTDERGPDFERAVAAAADADVAVLVVGDRAGHFRLGTVGEGSDASSLDLPGVQADLARAVLATGTPTVVVLLSGRPYGPPDVLRGAAAVLEAWFPGEAGGSAIVDVLCGEAEPTGRTVLSFPSSVGAMPYAYNHKPIAGGVPRLPAFDPVYPFGHGLSYTTFSYEDLAIAPGMIPADGRCVVSCRIRNTGQRAGEDVVQLYTRYVRASVTRPVLELKGFCRVALGPGEERVVAIELDAPSLAFTGLDLRKRVEPGVVRVHLGASSGDLRLHGRVELTGEVHYVGGDAPPASGLPTGP